MPASEIDDIFASKKQGAAAKPVAGPSSSKAPAKQEKKSSKKRKREAAGKSAAGEQSAEQPAKKRIPETVVDPSLQLVASSAKRSKQPKAERPAEAQKKAKVSREDEERFKDSRGTGPSMSLTTVNGLNMPCNAFRRRAQNGGRLFHIQGGRARYQSRKRRCVFLPLCPHAPSLTSAPETPLCPFDCQCCEYSIERISSRI